MLKSAMLWPEKYKNLYGIIKWVVFIGFIMVFSLLYCPYSIMGKYNNFGDGDSAFSLWSFNWELSRLASLDFLNLYNGNIFYPLKNVILFSESSLSNIIASLPVYLITLNPYTAYIVNLFVSFPLTALGMFLLARELKFSRNAAAVAAFIFAFSEFRFTFSGANFQQIPMQWMPLTLVFVHRYFSTHKTSNLIIAAVFFSLVSASTGYYFMSFSILCAIVFIFHILKSGDCRRKAFYKAAVPAVMIVIATAASIYFPYLQVHRNFKFTRSFSEQIGYGASLENYLSSANSYVLHNITNGFSRIEGNLSVRYTALLLVFTALFYYWKKGTARERPQGASLFAGRANIALALLACLAIVLSFFVKENRYGIPVSSLPHMMSLRNLIDNIPLLVPAFIFTPLIIALTVRMIFSKTVNGIVKQETMFLYLLISFTIFAMSLGPFIKIGEKIIGFNPIGLFLYGVFPGYDGMRAVSRAGGVVTLGVSILAAEGVRIIEEKIPRALYRDLIFWGIVVILAIESYPVRGHLNLFEDKTVQPPAKYLWLKEQRDNAPVLEWPLHIPFDGEGKYVEGSMIHGKPIVNGLSSYQWEGHVRLTTLAGSLDDDMALKAIYAFGVKYLIINAENGAFPLWAKHEIGQFTLAKEFPDALIYVNQDAKTQFPDDDFLKHFSSFSCEESGKDSYIFSIEFHSKDKYYVSRDKIVVEVFWNTGKTQHTDKRSINPALFADHDVVVIKVKKSGENERCSDVHSIFLFKPH
ncbi:MAG: hypothetical protein HQK99_03330 [Nitrospirae bacterium]|nr:hypothetical protein [Nitrospirota bacterium]